MSGPLENIAHLLRKSRKILVVGHLEPDCDALGSSLSLAMALQDTGKEAVCYNVSGLPNTLAFLKSSNRLVDRVHPRKKFDCTVFCDSPTLGRFGSLFEGDLSRFGVRVLIDHHVAQKPFADLSYLDSDRASCAELVLDLLDELALPLTDDIAFNLYAAIVSDTGSFRYSNTNRRAMETAGRLLDHDVSPWDVAYNLFESRSPIQMRLLAEAMASLEISDCGRYASVRVTREMMQRHGAEEYMLDRFVNYPRSIAGVEVAILMREDGNGEYKISFRSKGAVDVNEIARKFGGGGHHNAAGCRIEGSYEDVHRRLTTEVEHTLKRRFEDSSLHENL